MQIGIDLSWKQICGVLVCRNVVLATVTVSIYGIQREAKKEIMDKIISIIDSLFTSKVKAIGVSLPTLINTDKGVVYDIQKIPHWKNIRIKSIIEKQFRVPTYINADVNCLILGEKYHGACKDFKNLICVSLDSSVGTGVLINNKLYSDNLSSFTDAGCLSKASYQCVRKYNETYMRSMEELLLLMSTYDAALDFGNREYWNNMGAVLGRLVVVMLMNFDADAIVLGGELSHSFDYCVKGVKDYVNIFKPSYVTDDKYVIPAEVRDARAVGATYLAYDRSFS